MNNLELERAMPRFFVEAAPAGEQITLSGEDARHIVRVLRMQPGEHLTVCDGAGRDYACVLTDTGKDMAVCTIHGVCASAGEPDTRVTLFMALPKGDKMDFIVQKAVELGATGIVPFLGARSVSRPDAKTLQKKCERWQKIAREAAMQSGRGRIPVVGDPVSQAQAAKAAAEHDAALFLYENERETGIRQALAGRTLRSVALMVGPEGGFAPEEAEEAVRAGMQSVSLGPRILRCETAPLAALAAVMYETGNL